QPPKILNQGKSLLFHFSSKFPIVIIAGRQMLAINHCGHSEPLFTWGRFPAVLLTRILCVTMFTLFPQPLLTVSKADGGFHLEPQVRVFAAANPNRVATGGAGLILQYLVRLYQEEVSLLPGISRLFLEED